MPLILQKYILRADLKANPEALYAFGDNEERRGFGGQAAEMRGEPNAIGIATLKAPHIFWTDNDLADNIDVIDDDIHPLLDALAAGRVVVFPLDGVGTGLARLQERAPRTFAHLQARGAELNAKGRL